MFYKVCTRVVCTHDWCVHEWCLTHAYHGAIHAINMRTAVYKKSDMCTYYYDVLYT